MIISDSSSSSSGLILLSSILLDLKQKNLIKRYPQDSNFALSSSLPKQKKFSQQAYLMCSGHYHLSISRKEGRKGKAGFNVLNVFYEDDDGHMMDRRRS
jgi:hypothetical protein